MNAISILTAAGINPSIQRIQVLDYFLKNKIHPTAERIYSDLRQDVPAISKATVYKTLALFEEKGLITVIAIEEGKARYDFMESLHGHFICSSCKQVIDVPCEVKWHPSVKEFDVHSEKILMRGICKECLNKTDK